MSQLNPKKEFTINYSLQQVKEAILKLNTTEPNYYVLVSNSEALNQIRLHQKGSLLDMGYHIDFNMNKISDTETKVVVEISRNAGTINTASEMSIANNSMKTVTDKFAAFLENKVDAAGKPIMPKPTGCMLLALIVSLILLSTFAFSQIKEIHESEPKHIGKIEKGGIPIVTLSYIPKAGTDTNYILYYRNAEFKHVDDYKGVVFQNTGNAASALYAAMKSALKLTDDVRNSFKLGFDNISLSSFKDDDGLRKVFVYVDDKGYFTLSDKEIDKLFGKK